MRAVEFTFGAYNTLEPFFNKGNISLQHWDSNAFDLRWQWSLVVMMRPTSQRKSFFVT
jgi:hypothetical protein